MSTSHVGRINPLVVLDEIPVASNARSANDDSSTSKASRSRDTDTDSDSYLYDYNIPDSATPVGDVPNYLLQIDVSAPLSPHWPMPCDESHEAQEDQVDMSLKSATAPLISEVTASPPESSASSQTTDDHQVEEDTEEMPGHPVSTLSFEELQFSQPTYVHHFNGTPRSFRKLRQVLDRHVVDPAFTYSLEGIRKVFSLVEIERYFFCIELIKNPSVPSAYVLLHLHQFIVDELPLSSRLIQELMKEARTMHRYSLMFHIFSMQNQGLTFGGQPAPALMTLFLQAGHLYDELPSSMLHQPLVIEGMPDRDSMREMLVRFCDSVAQMVRDREVRGNPSLMTSMLITLGDYVEVDRAERLFNMITVFNAEKSILAHNAMLRLYSRCGMYEQALTVFKRMSASGVRPDAFSTRTLLSLFCANDPSAIETFLEQHRENRTLQTSYINFLLHKVCAQPPSGADELRLDLNHSGTTWVEDQSQIPGSISLLRYEDIPLYHAAALKYEYQARTIYDRLAAASPAVALIPFCDDSGVSFLSRVSPSVTDALPEDERWVLWSHRTSLVFLQSSKPQSIDASYQHAASALNKAPSYNFRGADESQQWSREVFQETFVPREYDSSELDSEWIDGDTDQYVITSPTPFTITIPNPRRCTGPYLYSDVVDATQPLTDDEYRAFITCTHLTDFPRDMLASADVPVLVRQAYEMFEVMPDMGCPPDHITYSSMTCVMELNQHPVDVIRMYNRLRLSCLAEHPMLHYRLATALYRTGMLYDAATTSQRIHVGLSHGPSLQTLWFDAFRANDLETMMTFANKIFVSVFSPHRAPILYFPRLFFICISYLFKGLAMSSYQGKSVFILEAIRHMHNHIQFFTSDNGIEPRSKTRLLLFGIKATQTLRRPELEVYLRQLIQEIDKTFVDRRKHEHKMQMQPQTSAHTQLPTGTRHARSHFWNDYEDNTRTVDVSAFSNGNASGEVSELVQKRRTVVDQSSRVLRNLETNEPVDEDTYNRHEEERRRALAAADMRPEDDDDMLELLDIKPVKSTKLVFRSKNT